MQSDSGLPPRPQGLRRSGPAATAGEGVPELQEGALSGEAASQPSPLLDPETPSLCRERGAPAAAPRRPQTRHPAQPGPPTDPPATPLVKRPMEEIRARARLLLFLPPDTEDGNFPVRIPKARWQIDVPESCSRAASRAATRPEIA